MTEPTDKEQYLNIADQCAATATSELAASILVDGGNGTLRQLLNDAADAIRAGWATQQPVQAQAVAITPPPIECNTEELKRAYAFGWWSALEKQRETAQTGAVPLTESEMGEGWRRFQETLEDRMAADPAGVRSMGREHWLSWAHWKAACNFALGIRGGQHGAE